MKTFIKRQWLWILVVTMLISFIVSMLLPRDMLPLDPRQDKLQHLVYFAALCVLSWSALNLSLLRQFMALAVIAGASELMQLLSPYRIASWADFFADIAGIILGCALVLIYQWWQKKK